MIYSRFRMDARPITTGDCDSGIGNLPNSKFLQMPEAPDLESGSLIWNSTRCATARRFYGKRLYRIAESTAWRKTLMAPPWLVGRTWVMITATRSWRGSIQKLVEKKPPQ